MTFHTITLVPFDVSGMDFLGLLGAPGSGVIELVFNAQVVKGRKTEASSEEVLDTLSLSGQGVNNRGTPGHQGRLAQIAE